MGHKNSKKIYFNLVKPPLINLGKSRVMRFFTHYAVWGPSTPLPGDSRRAHVSPWGETGGLAMVCGSSCPFRPIVFSILFLAFGTYLKNNFINLYFQIVWLSILKWWRRLKKCIFPYFSPYVSPTKRVTYWLSGLVVLTRYELNRHSHVRVCGVMGLTWREVNLSLSCLAKVNH
jgi:hypothetical protein